MRGTEQSGGEKVGATGCWVEERIKINREEWQELEERVAPNVD